MCQLFRQEANWGALNHWKDLWQEDTVRIVTQRLGQRAKRLPETTYANDRALDDGLAYWTSLASPTHFHVQNERDRVQPRQFQRLDIWGPMDDSRGRGCQSFVTPCLDPPTGPRRIASYKAGDVPTQRQCQDVLTTWLQGHTLDEEQKKDKVWLALSHLANNRPIDEDEDLWRWVNGLPEGANMDITAIDYEIYKVLKLGGGESSRQAHSRLYTRTTRSCNVFLRYQSYKPGVNPDEDGDVKLDYEALVNETAAPPRSHTRSRRTQAAPESYLQVQVAYPPPLIHACMHAYKCTQLCACARAFERARM